MMDVTKSDILKLFTRTVYVHSWHKVQIQKMLMHPSLAAAISFGNMLFGRGEANSVGTPCVVTSKYFVALFENSVAQPVPHAQSRDIRIPPSHCLLDEYVCTSVDGCRILRRRRISELRRQDRETTLINGVVGPERCPRKLGLLRGGIARVQQPRAPARMHCRQSHPQHPKQKAWFQKR